MGIGINPDGVLVTDVTPALRWLGARMCWGATLRLHADRDAELLHRADCGLCDGTGWLDAEPEGWRSRRHDGGLSPEMSRVLTNAGRSAAAAMSEAFWAALLGSE